MEDKCGIYKVTNQINNKSYIGKSKHIYLRWQQHHTEPFNKNANTYNTIFYRAIRKYGIDQFKFEILEECLEQDLNEREKYWIKKYNTFILSPGNQGYNMTEGGEKTVFQLQYDISLIEKLWNEGKTHQEILNIINCNSNILTRYLNYLNIDVNERRRRGSLYKGHAVQQFYMNGQFIKEYPTVSDAVRELSKTVNPLASTGPISYACNGKINSAYGYLWKYADDDTPIAIKVGQKHNYKQSKVNQYDLSGKYIRTYNTQEEARQAIGIKSISSITQACNGQNKTAGGYVWRYYDTSLENPLQDLILKEPIKLHNNQYYKQKSITHHKTSSPKQRKYKVDQYDLQGNYINTYSNMVEAAHAVGLKCENNIWKACNGQQKTAGGYIWKYNKEHMEVQ